MTEISQDGGDVSPWGVSVVQASGYRVLLSSLPAVAGGGGTQQGRRRGPVEGREDARRDGPRKKNK